MTRADASPEINIRPVYKFTDFMSPKRSWPPEISMNAHVMVSASPPKSPSHSMAFFPAGGANDAIGLLFPGAYIEQGTLLGTAVHTFRDFDKEPVVDVIEEIYSPASGYVSRVLCYGRASSSADEWDTAMSDLANRRNNLIQLSPNVPDDVPFKLRLKSLSVNFNLEYYIERDRGVGKSSDHQEQDKIVRGLLHIDREALPVERDIISRAGLMPLIETKSIAEGVAEFFGASDESRVELYEALIASKTIRIEAPAFLIREFAHRRASHDGASCHEAECSELGSEQVYNAVSAIRDEIDRLVNNASPEFEIDGNKQTVFRDLPEININGKKLWSIKSASIRNVEVEDFSFLREMPSLETLSIENCPISRAPSCSDLFHLDEINIKNCPLMDLSGFAQCRVLSILRVGHAPLHDISPLQKSRLHGLSIGRTEVADISAIEEMVNLEWISVEGTPVEDLTPLLKCPDLKRVYLRNCLAVQNDQRLRNLKEPEYDDEVEEYWRQVMAALKEQDSDTRPRLYASSIESPTNASGMSGIDELDRMIGLGSVKAEIKKLVVGAQYAIKRRERGLPVDQPTLHLVFTGNPGTGKTTVARLVGKIYRDLGLLSKGNVVEVARHDLIADYLGQTAGKTTKKLEEALDGVLFIDEAYTLAPDTAHQDYGREAIDAMLVFMENNRDRISIIAAGYAGEMQRFIGSNPGLKSRFTRYIEFEDYALSDCMEIFRNMVRDSQYELNDDAEAAAEQAIASMIAHEQPHFANGRSVRNLFEKVRERQNMRVVLQGVDEITLIEAEDIYL